MNSIQAFKNHLGQTNDHPLLIEVDYSTGSYIFDKNGKRYLDMISGVAVNNIGHRHPHVVEEIKKQVDKYLHTMVYGEFIQEKQTEFAQKLILNLPENLNSVYTVNSGTEANEAAIKLVKRFTGRSEIISFTGSYHGSSNGSLSISYNENKKMNFRPLLPDIRFLNWNSIDELDLITTKTAGVFLETIQGDAGVRIPSQEFIEKLKLKCNENKSLLVFDEIQCGMGRTGKLFAFEHFNISPDILTLGKGLGGGMPIGALISSKEILNSFGHNPSLGHITTFGGHPVICAAASACLDVFQNEISWDHVETLGKKIEMGLQHCFGIEKIRRIGLMFAIEMRSAELVNSVVLNCMKNGLLSFWFLSHPNCFRLSPPLNLNIEQADSAIEIIQKSIKESSKQYA